MKNTGMIMIIFLYCAFIGFCGNKAYHDVKMNVGKTAIVELSDTRKISLSITISPIIISGNKTYTQASPDAIDSSKRLYYSSIVEKGRCHKITVSGMGTTPEGTALFVEAVMLSGGSGAKGIPNGEIMIASGKTSIGGDLIRNIGSCVTGRSMHNGVQLNYRFKVIDPDTVDTNPGTNYTIIYSITDQ